MNAIVYVVSGNDHRAEWYVENIQIIGNYCIGDRGIRLSLDPENSMLAELLFTEYSVRFTMKMVSNIIQMVE